MLSALVAGEVAAVLMVLGQALAAVLLAAAVLDMLLSLLQAHLLVTHTQLARAVQVVRRVQMMEQPEAVQHLQVALLH
jgi:hypothetical protein